MLDSVHEWTITSDVRSSSNFLGQQNVWVFLAYFPVDSNPMYVVSFFNYVDQIWPITDHLYPLVSKFFHCHKGKSTYLYLVLST